MIFGPLPLPLIWAENTRGERDNFLPVSGPKEGKPWEMAEESCPLHFIEESSSGHWSPACRQITLLVPMCDTQQIWLGRGEPHPASYLKVGCILLVLISKACFPISL